MRISVSPAFVLFWTALYFFDTNGLFWSLLLAVLVHELCHFAAIRLTGGGVRKLELRLNGFVIVTDGLMSYRRELICAAAGPIGSAALAFIAARLGQYALSGISGALLAFNALPILPLDGGRMVYCAVAGLWGVSAAEKTMFLCALTVAAVSVIIWAVTGIWIFVYFAVISCCQIFGNGVKYLV